MPGAGLNFLLTARDDATPAIMRLGTAAEGSATATQRLTDTLVGFSSASKKTQATLLDSLAAQERYAAAANDSSASVARLASAQSALLRAQDRVAATTVTTSQKMATAGSAITKHLTLPLLAIGAVSVDQATKFTSAMTRIQTQAGASSQDVRTLSADVLSMAKTAQQGPVPLANALFHLKSVGLDNVGAMKALRQASDLAAVGGSNLEETTNALAGAWRTGIKGATDFKQAAATVNAIIGAGNMHTSDFMSALGTGILPVAKTYGLTLKDVGSALALFTDEGVPADEAATRLRMTFSLLGAPTNKAQKALTAVGLSSQDAAGRVTAMDTLLSKAGVTTNQLASDMRRPDGLLVAVQDLKKHLDNSHVSLMQESALLSKAFGGGRSSSTIMSLINNSGVLAKKYDQVAANMSKYNAAVAAQKATPEAQFKTLTANLEAASVALGTQLLPYLTTAAKDVTSVVQAFGHLSGTQKEIIGWSLGTVAALGPILSIGSRLAKVGTGVGNFVGGASNRLAALAGASEANALRVETAMRGISGALAGAGIGLAVGQFTKNASSTTKWLGALGSTAAGAAVGFSMGGPLGAAIGGVAGGLTDVVTAFGDTSAASKHAAATYIANMQSQISYTDQLKQSLQGVYNIQDAAAHKQVLSALSQGQVAFGGKSTLQYFHSGTFANVNPRDLLTAGETGSVAALLAKYPALEALAQQHNDYGKPTAIYAALLATLGKVHNGLVSVSDSNTLAAIAQGKNVLSAKRLGTSYDKLSAALKGNALDGVYAKEVIAENVEAITAASVANLKHGDSVTSVAAAYRHQITSMDANLAKLGMSQSAVAALNARYSQVPKTIITQMLKKGVSPADIDAILDKYHLIPPSLSTLLQLDDHASAAITVIQEKLNALHGKTITINVSQVGITGGATRGAKSGGAHGAYATGGRVGDGWFTVGEQGGSRGWELGHKSGSLVQLYSNAQARAMTGWDRVPGYASGTNPNDVYRVGSGYGFQGQFFGGKTGHKDADAARTSYLQSARSQAIYNRLNPTDAKSALSGLGALARSASSSLSDFQSGITALRTAASALGISGREWTRLVGKSTTQLLGDVAKRDSIAAQLGTAPTAPTAYDQLATAQQAYSDSRTSVAGATSAFDVTSAGIPTQVYTDRPAAASSAGTILAALTAAATKARNYAGLLKKLIREGLPQTLVEQLAAAGPSAYDQAQALSVATPKQILAFRQQSALLTAAGSTAGTSVANAYYMSGVTSAQSLVNGLLSQQKTLDREVAKLGQSLIGTLDRSLGIGSSHHKKTAKHIVAHGTGKVLAAHHAGGGDVTITQHIVTNDPRAAADAVLRKLELALK